MPTSATTLCGPRNGRRGSRSATQIRASTVLGRPISPSVGDRRVGSRAGSVTLVGIALVGIALASWPYLFRGVDSYALRRRRFLPLRHDLLTTTHAAQPARPGQSTGASSTRRRFRTPCTEHGTDSWQRRGGRSAAQESILRTRRQGIAADLVIAADQRSSPAAGRTMVKTAPPPERFPAVTEPPC